MSDRWVYLLAVMFFFVVSLAVVGVLDYGYDEQGPESPINFKDVAYMYGFSTVPLNQEMFLCIRPDSTSVSCMPMPPGSLLLIPHPQESLSPK